MVDYALKPWKNVRVCVWSRREVIMIKVYRISLSTRSLRRTVQLLVRTKYFIAFIGQYNHILISWA